MGTGAREGVTVDDGPQSSAAPSLDPDETHASPRNGRGDPSLSLLNDSGGESRSDGSREWTRPQAPAGGAIRRARSWLAVGRRRSLTGWLVFGSAFGLLVAVFGLPYSTDTILLWLTAALFVASLGNLRQWWKGMVVDWLPLYVVLAFY